MTMTMCSCACTAATLAEKAGAVDDLHLSATHQALSNHRQPPASVSQFQSFTACNPTSVTPHWDAASQSLHGSADLGHLGSTPGDGFPYHHDSTLEHHKPSWFQWFGPEDGPGDGLDDPGNGDDNINDDDDKFINTMDKLDLQNLAIAINHLSHSSCQTNDSSSSHATVSSPGLLR